MGLQSEDIVVVLVLNHLIHSTVGSRTGYTPHTEVQMCVCANGADVRVHGADVHVHTED